MTKAIVSGGAGFIGSFLCDYLLNKNYEVICIDNLITGNDSNIKLAMERFTDKFSFFEYDITDKFSLGCNDYGKIDHIYHLASPASPIDYLKYPLETLKTNSIGTYNMLELARDKRAKFLLASTSEIYGDPLVSSQCEDYWGNVNPIGYRSVYDESKRFAESLTMTYHRKYNLDTRIVRIFNTYGPRMKVDDGRVVSNFINQALKNEDITIYGDGSQTRSFNYVSDTVDGIYKLMMSYYNLPVNIGNTEDHTILEFAHIIFDLIHRDVNNKKSIKKMKIIFKDLPVDDPKQRKPDIRRAKDILNWEPKIDLKQGLIKTIEYFRTL